MYMYVCMYNLMSTLTFFIQYVLVMFSLPSTPPRSFPPPNLPNFMFFHSFSLLKKIPKLHKNKYQNK